MPTTEDVGCVLKYECSIADMHRPFYQDTTPPIGSTTARVRPAPQPPVRAIIPLRNNVGKVYQEGRFTVLTYNILADLYATVGAVERQLADLLQAEGFCVGVSKFVLSCQVGNRTQMVSS